MKIYYAHPMSWYGTDREKADVLAIESFGPRIEVVNPNSEKFKVSEAVAKENTSSMARFLFAVQDADAIAYRTFDDGYLGAGVAQEILTAYAHGKDIYHILDGVVRNNFGPMLFEQTGLRAAFGPRILTIIETRDRIKRGVM